MKEDDALTTDLPDCSPRERADAPQQPQVPLWICWREKPFEKITNQLR